MTVGHAQQKDGDITVTVDGLGLNKADALLQAKRSAVEKGIGTVLISQTEVENFEVKKDIILTKTTGAVKRYDILDEEKQSDGAYFVKIKAVVSLDSIKADLAALKILLESMDKPRMMVMIKEEGGNSAETAILDYLTEKEFDLVDPAAVAALMNEETELIWSDDLAKTIELLINSWLSLLDEEEIIEKRITVQSVALCPRQQEAYLYFDRYPFNKEESTFEKCIFLEGLLKTIRHNDIKIQLVRFLVHHEPMQDYHLDFSNSWPIAGFLESTAKGSNIIT